MSDTADRSGGPSSEPSSAHYEGPAESTEGPLRGYLVIDLTKALAGPHASMMLADMGARVIKVEPPGQGDDSRVWGPPFVGPEDDPENAVSTYFLSCNRNKESVTADLKSEEGRELFWSSARTCSSKTTGPARSTGSGSARSACRS